MRLPLVILSPIYLWLSSLAPASQTLLARFPAPHGCRRVAVAPGSWAEWLRYLPLRPAGTLARYYDGTPKSRPEVVAAVVHIDVGQRDLQQCADAVIRLRAEYLYTQDPASIHFHLTSGYDFRFADYLAGRTFQVRGDEVTPAPKAPEPATHAALGRYLIPTFTYAGTLSLSRELRPVPLPDVRPGDVLIHGGSPGHAVLVADVAENLTTHRKYMLLIQSYMPAQSMHVLRSTTGAWCPVPEVDEGLSTPEWFFRPGELARF